MWNKHSSRYLGARDFSWIDGGDSLPARFNVQNMQHQHVVDLCVLLLVKTAACPLESVSTLWSASDPGPDPGPLDDSGSPSSWASKGFKHVGIGTLVLGPGS